MAYPEGRVSNDYSGNNVGDSYGILKYINIFYGYTSTFTINLGQADYWWLRSPYTYYVGDGAYRVRSDSDVDFNSNVRNSYGRRPALRGLITPTMPTSCTQRATSATATTVCIGVPAAGVPNIIFKLSLYFKYTNILRYYLFQPFYYFYYEIIILFISIQYTK